MFAKYSYLSRSNCHQRYIAHIHKQTQHQLLYQPIRCYSLDTPPEELQRNVVALADNIDMKNLTLQTSGGRSSVSGIRATVFGASSQIGIHLNT